MSVVCVAKYHTVEEALVARSKLEFYGIPAWFPEEHTARIKWVYLRGASHCHIEVPRACEDDARFLLQENDPCAIEEYDEYGSSAFYKTVMWFTFIGIMGYVVVLPLLDHLYCWLKSKRNPT